MALTDKSVRDLLAAFSSKDPTPGGGSASALASAVGASLLMMVAALPKTKSGTEEGRAAPPSAAGVLAYLRKRLTAAIDTDSAAYDRVVAAYKLPKASADEQTRRKAEIQDALQGATAVPLSVLRMSAAGLEQAITIATYGHRAAASDVGVAVALLRAGAAGARLNVEINVGSITDLARAEAMTSETVRLTEDAARSAGAAEALLRDA